MPVPGVGCPAAVRVGVSFGRGGGGGVCVRGWGRPHPPPHPPPPPGGRSGQDRERGAILGAIRCPARGRAAAGEVRGGRPLPCPAGPGRGRLPAEGAVQPGPGVSPRSSESGGGGGGESAALPRAWGGRGARGWLCRGLPALPGGPATRAVGSRRSVGGTLSRAAPGSSG